MPTVDEILAGSPLADLRRISPGGGDRRVTVVRLAERFAELDDAPPGSFVVLSRLASAEVTDYRLDRALRWAAIRRVAAVAAFSAEAWQPAVTALDIAEHADIALVSVPADADLAVLVQAVYGEIGGSAERALARAEQGLEAVRRAERAGAGPEELGQAAGRAGYQGRTSDPRGGVSVPVQATRRRPAFRRAGGGRRDRYRRRAGPARGGRRRAAPRPTRRAIQTPVRSQQRAARRAADVGLGDQQDLLTQARQLGSR
jgi:hypothetical protein